MLWKIQSIVFFFLILADISSALEPPFYNWSYPYDVETAKFALDLAAAVYSSDPTGCLGKHNLTLNQSFKVACDSAYDECWAYIAFNDDYIVFAVRGTKTTTQLILELLETMSIPKRKFVAGGSVQRYFYVAMKSLWNVEVGPIIRKLKITNPGATVLFVGHSLGGAIASLCSSMFAHENSDIISSSDIRLITFGQPRTGNLQYAITHDSLVPNSWRIVHKNDIVAHIPYCIENPFSRRCTSLYNHGPYHHGTEIFYDNEMTSGEYGSTFRICTSEPINEDGSCSNSNSHYIHYNVKDHLTYFGVEVSQYGVLGCKV